MKGEGRRRGHGPVLWGDRQAARAIPLRPRPAVIIQAGLPLDTPAAAAPRPKPRPQTRFSETSKEKQAENQIQRETGRRGRLSASGLRQVSALHTHTTFTGEGHALLPHGPLPTLLH